MKTKSEITDAVILFKKKDETKYDWYVIGLPHHCDPNGKDVYTTKIEIKNNRVIIFMDNNTSYDVPYDDNVQLRRKKITDAKETQNTDDKRGV
jgi:hypothetical protein